MKRKQVEEEKVEEEKTRKDMRGNCSRIEMYGPMDLKPGKIMKIKGLVFSIWSQKFFVIRFILPPHQKIQKRGEIFMPVIESPPSSF